MSTLLRAGGSLFFAVLCAGAEAHAAETTAQITFTEHGVPHIRASNYAGLGFGYGYAAASPYSPAAETKAQITFTEHGIPHIRASNYAGLGFGYGYAAASLDLCALADVFLDVRGERARYLGASTSQSSGPLKRMTENETSDFAVHLLADESAVAAQREGLTPDTRDLVGGYADGFNRYLQDTPQEKRPRRCRDAQWVKPITADDVLRRVISAVLVGGMFNAELYDAHPPSTPATAFRAVREPIEPTDVGSNAIAFGAQRTSHGRGLLLGNPHWLWEGSNRFMQAHLTIPGSYDVSGVSVLGMPLINIGYNRSMAWTHTVATDYRATVYELTLDPADPTRYLVDGESRPMTRRDVSIDVRNGDGSVTASKHTFWISEYGPMIASAKLPWTTKTAYALADGDVEDTRYLRQLLEMGKAANVSELKRVLAETLGLVWVNTIATDSRGKVLYADYNVIPNVPRSVFDSCTRQIAFPQATLANVMDGSRSACRWRSDSRSRTSTAMPSDDKPALLTRDYVENSNSSYWLVNAKAPLEGYSPMIGRERTPPNLRTRFGHLLAAEYGTAVPGGSERGDMEKLEAMLFSNRDYLAELVLDDLLKACADPARPARAEQQAALLQKSCDVLSHWDRKDELSSKGAALFREFAREVKPVGEEDPAASTSFWSVPFDPNKPLETPRGLNTASSAPLEALLRAAERLTKMGIPLDKPLEDIQFIERNGKRIPLHGGLIFNRISLTLKSGVGYTEPIGSANSYLQVVSFDDSGPIADTLLVNSQSGDPDSPWYADQAELYARKNWVSMPFFAKDVALHAVGKPIELSYRAN
jgi:acyl-homoserine-lactone acylase